MESKGLFVSFVVLGGFPILFVRPCYAIPVMSCHLVSSMSRLRLDYDERLQDVARRISLSFPSLFELSYSFPHLIRFPCINRVGYHTVPLLVFSSFYTFLLYECTGFYLFLSFFQQWVYMDLVTAFLSFPCFFFSFRFFSFLFLIA